MLIKIKAQVFPVYLRLKSRGSSGLELLCTLKNVAKAKVKKKAT